MNKYKLLRTIAIISLLPLVARSAGSTRGVPRPDLVGKLWRQLPSTQFPGFGLPMAWKSTKKYELRLFEPVADKYIVTITEALQSGNDDRIISAVDFTALGKSDTLEHDCFYGDIPSCNGRLCDGLLIGVIDQSVFRADNTFEPKEVWKITLQKLKFEKVSVKNVVCKPQSYSSEDMTSPHKTMPTAPKVK